MTHQIPPNPSTKIRRTTPGPQPLTKACLPPLTSRQLQSTRTHGASCAEAPTSTRTSRSTAAAVRACSTPPASDQLNRCSAAGNRRSRPAARTSKASRRQASPFQSMPTSGKRPCGRDGRARGPRTSTWNQNYTLSSRAAARVWTTSRQRISCRKTTTLVGGPNVSSTGDTQRGPTWTSWPPAERPLAPSPTLTLRFRDRRRNNAQNNSTPRHHQARPGTLKGLRHARRESSSAGQCERRSNHLPNLASHVLRPCLPTTTSGPVSNSTPPPGCRARGPQGPSERQTRHLRRDTVRR